MVVIQFNNSDSFDHNLLATTYVSIAHLSYYNLKQLRDWRKIKELRSAQVRAL